MGVSAFDSTKSSVCSYDEYAKLGQAYEVGQSSDFADKTQIVQCFRCINVACEEYVPRLS